MKARTINVLPIMLNAALRGYLTPKLAQDAALDLKPVVRGVTPATWAADKPRVKLALDAALKGKLASDADVSDVIEVLDQLDDVKEQVAEAVAAGTDPADPAPGEDADGDMMGRLMEFLAGKLSDEDMDAVKTLMKPEVDPGAAPAKDAQTGAKPAAKDAAKEPAKGETVSKQAMDAAIGAAVQAATQATLNRLNAVKAAEKAVRPYVGELAIAQDSAEGVYRLALDTLKIDTKGVPAEALPHILAAQPLPGATPARRALAMDAAGAKSFLERFPGADRLSK